MDSRYRYCVYVIAGDDSRHRLDGPRRLQGAPPPALTPAKLPAALAVTLLVLSPSYYTIVYRPFYYSFKCNLPSSNGNINYYLDANEINLNIRLSNFKNSIKISYIILFTILNRIEGTRKFCYKFL